MTTLSDVKNGATLPTPLYVTKPYVVTNNENVVLFAGTLDEIKQLGGYYNTCQADIRRYPLEGVDNTRTSASNAEFVRQARRTLLKISKNRYHPRRREFCAAWMTWAKDRPYVELVAALRRVDTLIDEEPKASAAEMMAAVKKG